MEFCPPSFDLIATAGAVPASQVQAQVDEYTAALDKELGQVIGTTAVEMDTRRAAIRSQETAFGNLVADASRAATNADVATAMSRLAPIPLAILTSRS